MFSIRVFLVSFLFLQFISPIGYQSLLRFFVDCPLFMVVSGNFLSFIVERTFRDRVIRPLLDELLELDDGLLTLMPFSIASVEFDVHFNISSSVNCFNFTIGFII